MIKQYNKLSMSAHYIGETVTVKLNGIIRKGTISKVFVNGCDVYLFDLEKSLFFTMNEIFDWHLSFEGK